MEPALSFGDILDVRTAYCSCNEWEQRGGSPTWQFIEWWKHVSEMHPAAHLEQYIQRERPRS